MVAEQQVCRRAWAVRGQGWDERPNVLEHHLDGAVIRPGEFRSVHVDLCICHHGAPKAIRRGNVIVVFAKSILEDAVVVIRSCTPDD